MKHDLAGKVAVVHHATGPAGRRIALALAAEGARVVAVADDQRALAELAPHVELALSAKTPLQPVLEGRFERVDLAVDVEVPGALLLSSDEPLERLMDRARGARPGLLRRVLRRARRIGAKRGS